MDATLHRADGFRARIRRAVAEDDELAATTARRIRVLAAVLIVVGAVAFAVLLVGVLLHVGPQRLDRPVEQWFDARRDGDRTVVLAVLAEVFGPVGMPIVVAITLVAWIAATRRVRRPLLLLAGMATGVVLAQVLAPIVRHPRPPIGMMLLGPDHTFSFPSGHVLGMSDFFLLAAYLLASRVRRPAFTVLAVAVAVAAVSAQVVSRLYLGYHWFTDVSGSLALSLVIVGVVMLVDVRSAERHRTAATAEARLPQSAAR